MIVTKRNYDYKKSRFKRTFGPSLTVPDQSMPLREIIERYSVGQPVSLNAKQPIFNGDESPFIDRDVLNSMDLAEREDYFDSLQVKLKDLRQQVEDRKLELQRKTVEFETERSHTEKEKLRALLKELEDEKVKS